MRIKTALAALLVAAIFLLGSCQKSARVWDESLPEETLASVRFSGFAVDSFNGIPVSKFNWVKIPAGVAAFGGVARIAHAGVTFTISDMEFSFVLDAGGDYIAYATHENMLWGVSVYNAEGWRLRPENKIAFIPFRNQP